MSTDTDIDLPDQDAAARALILSTLVEERKHLQLTQRDLAARMHISQPVVSQIEREIDDPHLSTLQRYARALCGRIIIAFVADEDGQAAPDGWLPFGTHAVMSPLPALEFSDQVGEDGLPLFERCVSLPSVIDQYRAQIAVAGRSA